MIVYKLTNLVNGMVYVGQTMYTLERRFKQHAKCKTSLIGKAIQEFGIENFSTEILDVCETKKQLNELERFWIRVLKCKFPKGYNATNGGGCSDKPVRRERERRQLACLLTIISTIDKLGNRKMQVVKYLLKEMDSNNLLIKTIAEIEKESGVSDKTIRETLKILEKANIIHRRTGVIMISPKLVNRGNAQKEHYLLTKFRQMD